MFRTKVEFFKGVIKPALAFENKDGKVVIPCLTCENIKFDPVLFEIITQDKVTYGHASLSEMRKELIDRTGTENPDLFIVGEAPGKTEAEQHRPFVGKSGELLRNVLSMAAPCSVVIGNSVLCRPIKSHQKAVQYLVNRTPSDAEIMNCSRLVKHTAKYLKPKALLLLGRSSFSAFLPNRANMSMGAARYLTFDKPKFAWFGIPVFISWHPSYVWRKGGPGSEAYYEFVDDIARAIRG